MKKINKIIRYIRNNYLKPGSPIAFSSPKIIYDFLKKRGEVIQVEKIREILQEYDSYNLHKKYSRPRYFNAYFIYSRRQQVQADLIDIRDISKENDGVNYLFLLIDCFSRKIWVYPLKTKTGKEVSGVFKKHLEDTDRIPLELVTDAGTEFTCKDMRELYDKFSIYFQIAGGFNKVLLIFPNVNIIY